MTALILAAALLRDTTLSQPIGGSPPRDRSSLLCRTIEVLGPSRGRIGEPMEVDSWRHPAALLITGHTILVGGGRTARSSSHFAIGRPRAAGLSAAAAPANRVGTGLSQSFIARRYTSRCSAT
jgi:hypothetical protein